MMTREEALDYLLAHVDSRLGSGANQYQRLDEAEAVLRKALREPEGVKGWAEEPYTYYLSSGDTYQVIRVYLGHQPEGSKPVIVMGVKP